MFPIKLVDTLVSSLNKNHAEQQLNDYFEVLIHLKLSLIYCIDSGIYLVIVFLSFRFSIFYPNLFHFLLVYNSYLI